MSKLLELIDLGEYLFEVYDDKPNFEFIEVKQIHSSIVVLEDLAGANNEADGIITLDLNTPLAIKTADCLPIAIIGDKGCALIHAGWRGIESSIIKSKSIQKIEPKLAYIGPHIFCDKYEVGEEFKEYFPDLGIVEIEGSLYLDMDSIAISQLKETYANVDVKITTNCTFANDEFNSYRRNKTDKRNWNILRRK